MRPLFSPRLQRKHAIIETLQAGAMVLIFSFFIAYAILTF